MQNNFKEILDAIMSASNIVITAHRSPDGDSIGSSLALYHFISAQGKEVSICHPDPAPDYLNWLDHIEKVLNMEVHPELVGDLFTKADLIFSLDYNATDRVGASMQTLLEASKAKKIMIDHHLHPQPFADIMVSNPEVSSTSQLIFELIDCAGLICDARMGIPIYLGMLTDTGSFRFSSVQPRTHEIIAKLLAAGVQHHLIHEQLNDNNTVNRLKLHGYAMSEKLEVLEDHKTVIISLTEEELKRFNYQKGDTEGLVNLGLSIKGMKASVFLAQKDGIIKISFRSKGEKNPINTLAADHFSGGGHANAAGGKSELSMEETISKLKELIPAYF